MPRTRARISSTTPSRTPATRARPTATASPIGNSPPGDLNIAYTEDTRNASKYGGAAQFLFGTHDGLGNEWLRINFECVGNGGNNGGGSPTGGNGNPSDGGSPATPEPGVPLLSLIAAGAMAVLLVGRKARQRIGAKRA